MSEDSPTAGAILGGIGGLFVLIGGWFLGSIGSALSNAGYYAGGNAIGALGLWGDFVGLLLLVLSYRLYSDPEHHVGYGIGLIILGLLSFPGGAGFLIGLILCVIGGILGIIWEGEDVNLPQLMEDPRPPSDPWNPTIVSPARSPPSSTAASPPSAPKLALPTNPPGSPAAPVSAKTCPICGTVFERSRNYCPQCGALAP